MPTSNHSTLLREITALPSGQRATQLRALGDAAGLLIALGDEAEKLVVVEVSSAISSAELLVALSDEMNLPGPQARSRRALGQALAYSGRFEQALRVCEDAAAIAEAAGEAVQAARARLASIHALGELGRYAEAVETGVRAWRMLIDAGEPALAARADLNLGVIYRKWDQPRKAVEHFDRAREGLKREPMILAQLHSNRGEALLAIDDLEGAEAAFREALPVFEEAGHQWGAAIVEGNLADLAARQGHLDRALFHFESARRHIERDESPTHLARILVEQGDAKAALGMLLDALADYQAALPVLDEHHQPAEAARARAGLAPVLVRLGRLEDADQTLADALAQLEALGQVSAQSRLLLVRAELARRRGRIDDATHLADRALEIARDRPIDAAVARHRLGWMALDRGDCDAAATMADEALRVAEAAGITPLIADLLHLRGCVLHRRGDFDGSVSELRRAVHHLERVRSALQAERFRAAFLGDRLAAYESLVRAIIDRGGESAATEALEAAELAKSRALSDLVRGSRAVGETAADRRAESSALVQERLRLQEQLNNWYRRQPGNIDQPWRMRAAELEQALSSLEARIASTQTVRDDLDSPISAQEIQLALDEQDVLVEYFAVEDDLLVFCVTRHAVTAQWAGLRMQTVRDLVRRVQFQLGRALRPGALQGPRAKRLHVDADSALRALHDAVIPPMIAAIQDGSTLIVIPHGPLHAVPFAALHNGEGYLVEAYEIITAPSAGLLARLTKRSEHPARSGDRVVVSVADDMAPRIRDEAEEVAAILHPVQLLQDSKATVDAVAAAVATASLVHFSCHGRFDSQNPLGSGLRMYDRWLTVRDAYRLRLHNAVLVLSGCETGQSRVGSGDELAGLLRGFFAAGASSALVSLWVVEDASAIELMRRFYGNLGGVNGGRSSAAALREAQCGLLRKGWHPVLWAPFILVGRS